ncbi:MAG: DUF3237 family protein [Anaerolineae bacterium]|nr:DUF3237 family protein [Anaerolineae bacterium]
MSAVEIGEHLYDVEVQITKVVEFGVSLADLLAGKVAPPPEGARLNVHFEGEWTGKVSGKVTGTDFITVRADGTFQVHIHGELTAPNGDTLAFFNDGIAIPDAGGIAHLREHVVHHSSCPSLKWLNSLDSWAVGTANMGTGIITLKGYAVK